MAFFSLLCNLSSLVIKILDLTDFTESLSDNFSIDFIDKRLGIVTTATCQLLVSKKDKFGCFEDECWV